RQPPPESLQVSLRPPERYHRVSVHLADRGRRRPEATEAACRRSQRLNSPCSNTSCTGGSVVARELDRKRLTLRPPPLATRLRHFAARLAKQRQVPFDFTALHQFADGAPIGSHNFLVMAQCFE